MRELPVRRHPRLKGYDYSKVGCYFITICTKDRHEMLGEVIVGRDVHIAPDSHTAQYVQLSEYGIVVNKHIEKINSLYSDIHIDNYVIMPNHIHILITVNCDKNHGAMWTSRPTDATIPKLIRSFKTMVTKELGFSIWQDSYHDHIIRNDNEYQRICLYIDENPARWEGDKYHPR